MQREDKKKHTPTQIRWRVLNGPEVAYNSRFGFLRSSSDSQCNYTAVGGGFL